MGVRRDEQKAMREEVDKRLERDKVMWKQRSKVLWLREGGQNSKFFHTKVFTEGKRTKLENFIMRKGHGRKEI